MNIFRHVEVTGVCSESSRHAKHSLPGTTAGSLLVNEKSGDFSIHSASEDRSPWWQIKFAQPTAIDAIVVFNRERFPERAASLQVSTSNDGKKWNLIFDNSKLPTKEQIFGGAAVGPRTIWTNGTRTRFLRLSLADAQPFHLAGIQFYRSEKFFGSKAENALNEIFGIADQGATEIAKENLRNSGISSDKILRHAIAVANGNQKSILTAIEYLAESGRQIDPSDFVATKISASAIYVAAVNGALASKDAKGLENAKAAYANLARLAPDNPNVRILHERLLASEKRGSEQLIKLIIWDLDDTLWQGTLAEGDDVQIFERRRELVHLAVERGMINSVVSKNDPAVARTKLEQFDLIRSMTHPVVAFRPKGELIKGLITALQLREQNVLFIDDNPLNLHEAQFYCPKLQVMDARDEDTDAKLTEIIMKSPPDGGKRHADYQVIARKLDEEENFSGDNEDFLRQSGIEILLVAGNSNFSFADRIEDFVNRSNQMNFLKTRIPVGTGTHITGDTIYRPYSVFVRDRFGSYGLVGFACVHATSKKLIHFAFSCRIMNMKVENVVMGVIERDFGPQPHCPVKAELPEYIKVLTKPTKDFAKDIEEVSNSSDRDILVMANCQSGIISHYLGLSSRVEAEQAPDVFTLATSRGKEHSYSERYKILIYGVFVDYLPSYWGNDFLPEKFEARFDTSLAAWSKDGATVYVILPPDRDQLIDPTDKRHQSTFADINQIATNSAKKYANVHIVKLDDFIEEKNDVSNDLRHYSRTMLRRTAEYLNTQIAGPAIAEKAVA